MEDKKWIYIKEEDNRARYVLGYIRNNPLIIVGVNPSTAEPNRLDPTLTRAEQIAFNNGYDSFIFLNVYPERSTDFNKLPTESNDYYLQRNLQEIEDLLSDLKMDNPTVWLAYGDLIEKRNYLKESLGDMMTIFKRYNCRFLIAGEVTRKGNPRHPLYLKHNILLNSLF